MTVNKIIMRTITGDTNIVVPIGNTFDESMGKSDALTLWDLDQVQNNINPILDFETERFSPKTIGPDFHIFYSMLFATLPTPSGNVADYEPDYSYVGITYPNIKDRKNLLKVFLNLIFIVHQQLLETKYFFLLYYPLTMEIGYLNKYPITLQTQTMTH